MHDAAVRKYLIVTEFTDFPHKYCILMRLNSQMVRIGSVVVPTARQNSIDDLRRISVG